MDYSLAWTPIDNVLLYFCATVAVAGLLIYVSKENPESSSQLGVLTDERTSMYECGFEPFQEPQELFFVPYFSTAVLFLIFDLELIYLFPWLLYSEFDVLRSAFIVSTFLVFIVFGLLLEWRAGSLNFSKPQQLVF